MGQVSGGSHVDSVTRKSGSLDVPRVRPPLADIFYPYWMPVMDVQRVDFVRPCADVNGVVVGRALGYRGLTVWLESPKDPPIVGVQRKNVGRIAKKDLIAAGNYFRRNGSRIISYDSGPLPCPSRGIDRGYSPDLGEKQLSPRDRRNSSPRGVRVAIVDGDSPGKPGRR